MARARISEKIWRKALHDGIIAGAKPVEAAKASVDAKKLAAAIAAEPKASTDGIEVAFVASAATWDGRFANNAWMQEAPDPMTKLTWGNAALISPGHGACTEPDRWRYGHAVARQLQNGSRGDDPAGPCRSGGHDFAWLWPREMRTRGQGCRVQREPDPHSPTLLVRERILDRAHRQEIQARYRRRSTAPSTTRA